MKRIKPKAISTYKISVGDDYRISSRVVQAVYRDDFVNMRNLHFMFFYAVMNDVFPTAQGEFGGILKIVGIRTSELRYLTESRLSWLSDLSV